MMAKQLADAWGDFLAGYPWDWFLTLTFRDPPGSFRAHRMFDRFARDIEKAAGVPTGWFRGDEYGPLGGRLHIHALMLNTAHLPRIAWLNEWNRRAGFARILPFDATRGAAFYCAKYVTKEFGDHDFSENIQAFKCACPAVQPALYFPAGGTGSPATASGQLAFPSKPKNRNSAEDPLIAALDGTQPVRDPQISLLPEK